MTNTSIRANLIKKIINILPFRRFQVMYWLTKILGLKRRFLGDFHQGMLEINPLDPASKCAFFFGFYEKETTTWFLEKVKDKKITFFDIGANFGYFSFLCALYSKPGSIIVAFEPDPHTRSWLERNNKLNGSKLTIEPLAISSNEGEVEFLSCSTDEQNALWSRIELDYTKKTASSPGVKKIKVNTKSLDKYLNEKNIKEIDLLKIDVEGAEGFVLEGMKETLKNKIIKSIFIEFHNGSLPVGQKVSQMIEAITSQGYKAFHLQSSLITKESDLQGGIYKLDKLKDSALVPMSASMNVDEMSDWEHFVFERVEPK